MCIRNYNSYVEEERAEKWHNEKMRKYRETKIMLEIENLRLINKKLKEETEDDEIRAV